MGLHKLLLKSHNCYFHISKKKKKITIKEKLHRKYSPLKPVLKVGEYVKEKIYYTEESTILQHRDLS